jgi:hypothetical protein
MNVLQTGTSNETRINLELAPPYDQFNSSSLYFGNYDYKTWKNNQLLPREFSVDEHKQLMDLVELTDKFFKMHQVEYMITDGSLIGSLRHWDVVPWDDDFVIIYFLRLFEFLSTWNVLYTVY